MTGSDLVLVPAFARPEYLHLCLEHLQAAGARRIWIAQDAHHRDSVQTKACMAEVRHVAQAFGCHFVQREPHNYIGNPYNILELYKRAFESDARYVYLVEDDVIVGADFFRWHEAVQERGDYFCSVGWHCIRNERALKSNDPAAYIESGEDFSSIGVCWRREKLAAVVEHARTDYYRDLSGYMRKNFPHSPIPPAQWTEQAGLIMRLLLADLGKKVAWPTLARCAHIGMSGYHRSSGYAPVGDLNQRIENLRHLLNDGNLRSVAQEFDDISALPQVPAWSDLRMEQRIGL